MGEVYKARDTRLDRTVAIKVLPEHIAKREDLRARFEREARAVASLNHPHICTLYDIGNQDGAGYMVMEYMEGETLAARIGKGAFPLDPALQFATQIADALDRAHRAGVTHRDVKPQNIMLTRDGVKVLDFGLAKSMPKPGPAEETLTAALTIEGTLLGTPQYMAPEQFEGKEADARSDIWAFGAVLYEMVTGQKAFQGKSYSSLVGAILSADPPPMSVKPFTPAWLERLVRRCLAKNPEDRYQSMRDIVLDLRAPLAEAPPHAPKSSRLGWAVAGACLIAALLGWGAWLKRPGTPGLRAILEVSPPEGSRFAGTESAGGSAISPDGRTLAFIATNAKSETLLYLRSLESLEARALPGTEDAGRPFWSPDSKSLAFVARGKLKRIDVAGGAPIVLCATRAPRGGAWSKDGVILFGEPQAGLQRVAATGGTPATVTQFNAEAGATSHYYPQFLPDGKQFLYHVRSASAENMGVFLGTLDGKPPTKIVQTEFQAAYDVASGRLLYIQGNGTLMARKLELDRPGLTGDPSVVAETVRNASSNGYAEFSVSGTGTLLFGRGGNSSNLRFVWKDRTGKVLETIGQPEEAIAGFSLSPDGNRVAYAKLTSTQSHIWVMELARGLSSRSTFGPGLVPHWSPDGKQLYYNSPRGIYRKAADGAGDEEPVLKTDGTDWIQSISPDGKHLLYGAADIKTLPLTGERKPEAYLNAKHSEAGAAFSPNGRWVAYASDESGRQEIYVQGFPDRRGKWLISAAGGRYPGWRGDGKELYWLEPENFVTAAGVDLQAEGVKLGRPEPLFRLSLQEQPFEPFQPSRDGRRFLVQEPEGGQKDLPMVVVQNWAARLGK